MDDLTAIVASIHAAKRKLVIATTGGGASAIAALLAIPGGSQTLLEAIVPYAERALSKFLGGQPDKACSVETARAMSAAAFDRIHKLVDEADTRFQGNWVGVSCTASLATSKPKKGPHQFFIGIQTSKLTETWSLNLEKNARTREQEERLLCRTLINRIANACGVSDQLDIELGTTECPSIQTLAAVPDACDLLTGRMRAVLFTDNQPRDRIGVDDHRSGLALLPGAFHPLHDAHRRLAEIAFQKTGRPVNFEISAFNVDKPPLDFISMDERVRQFSKTESVWVTNARTFVEKSRLFPGAIFVVGADTIIRVGAPKYYYGSNELRDAAIREIAANDCRFLIFGRQVGKRFCSLSNSVLPDSLARLCEEVTAQEFRMDLSSTELRKQADACYDL